MSAPAGAIIRVNDGLRGPEERKKRLPSHSLSRAMN